ncbi:cytochrome P450 [Emericellopsis cladophorae]|uniref:Cytochrome P450 n=1 Tax=Emericellopsis cladophorae TaxID=2686198 RepID=A0A9Q0BDJ2_9HYPO|nr:cytochrome P450 [Emericellopsis cladophorae]KAI6780605.1 cytochrome P450 [Emericellopsis cladophorae]
MAYSTPTVAFALVGAFILLYLVLPLGKRSSSAVSLPPGPKPAPVIGNIHQLPKSMQWLHLYHLSKEYGPIMHFSMAGKPLIILSTHEAAHDLLNKRGARYSDRPRMVMAGELVTRGMHLLLRQYDDQYKLHQRMEAPLFTPKSASMYRRLQDLESQQLLLDEITEMETHGEKGVNFHHHHERAMASTVYCLIYGYRLKTGYEQSLQDGKKVEAAFVRTGQVGAYLVDSIPAINRLPRFLAPWKKEADELFALECNLHEGNLHKGLSNPGWNFSKHMKASPEGKDMDKTELAFDLGVLADAGLDTSTVALDWFIVAWVTSGSTWVSKAQKLLDEVVGKDRMPTFDDRPKLAFIDAIVSETLRWRPVAAGGVPHFTKTEDSYMDYRIPANSIVLPNSFAICRDESVFGANPNSFDPERWMTGDTTQPPTVDACGLNTSDLKDLPQTGFGYGRRICAGRIIARNHLFIEMARMLWAFDVEAGIREDTGERYVVDDMDCTEGFVTLPKPFRTVMKVRGEYVTRIVKERGTTHNIDHAAVLEQMKVQRN